VYSDPEQSQPMARPKLTTTSYALLGHLAMRPWTMYELAAQMRRNIRFFYPRAESQVYEEPKRLVALGLAKAEKAASGRRVTTTYSITPAGQRELKRWLAEAPSRGAILEFEGLLRVFLAPFGDVRDLTATFGEIRREIAGLIDTAETIRNEYLDGKAPFQRYAPTRAMVHDFLFHFGVLIDEWAARSLNAVANFQVGESARNEAALAAFRRNTRRP